MKLMNKRIFVLTLCLVMTLSLLAYFGACDVKADTGNADYITMNRLYNPNSGEHFYTMDTAEKKHLVSLGWNDEGVGWYAPVSSNTPVYRLYNKNGGEHHYTTSKEEKDNLVKAGWIYESIGWYSDDSKTIPVYRQYNPNAFANNHNYTTNADEKSWLIRLGWQDEDIGWYGVSKFKANYTYELYLADNYPELGNRFISGWFNYRMLYIKTDNPDFNTFMMKKTNGDYLSNTSILPYPAFDDVNYLDEDQIKVDGGYLMPQCCDETGTFEIAVIEKQDDEGNCSDNGTNMVTAKTLKVTAVSSDSLWNNWYNQVMKESGANQKNTSIEKLQAVVTYFTNNNDYKYLTSLEGTNERVHLLREPNSPYYLTKRWDSYTSPQALCDIAEKIGGFDEIHNCYFDYPLGSEDWQATHYKMYVTYKDSAGTEQKSFFEVCPLEETGAVPAIQKVDFSDTSQFAYVG